MSEDKNLPEDLEATYLPETAADSLQRIGNYRLLQKIGEGGMGEVWEADQEKPVRRRVALKIIKHGMDTKQVVARFEAEQQALALMDHPCVAKVFDAGSTPQGRPFFAMEHVQGVPITKHCDRQRLTMRERLELFLQVCGGVQHAHQKAVIHRDLKPSNVLVTIQGDKPLPKIIDFGVAKATAQRLTERTLFTEMGVLIGTPEYMSPEQAEMTGQDVDTRTDVYSLGVMLYELLTGALPFESEELRESGFEGIRRKIREEEPSKPSTRLGTLGDQRSTESARRRRTDLPTLRRQLRGDLDWITIRALEKDRMRRYGSPSELAADLERHLRNQPVVAGPPSATYRAGKFVRRHRLGVGVAAAGVTVVLAFAVTMSVQAGRIARERDRANREAEAARQTSEFLENLFEISDPDEAQGSTVTARELLDRSVERMRSGGIEHEEVRARLLLTMGGVYRKLGLYESAEPLLAESLALRQALLGDDHPDTLHSLNNLGILLRHRGDLDGAERCYREVLDVRRRTLGNDHPDTLTLLNNMGTLLLTRDRAQDAEGFYREALEGRRRVLGGDDADTLNSIRNLGYLLWRQHRYGEAEPYYREALDGRRRVLGNDHPSTLESLNDMGGLLLSLDNFDEAEKYLREALRKRRRILGDDHPATLITIGGMGNLFSRRGRKDKAESYFRQVLEGRRGVLHEGHSLLLVAISNLAGALEAQDKLGEAALLRREAVEQLRLRGSAGDAAIASALIRLGTNLNKQKRYNEAEPLLRECLAIRQVELGEDHWLTANTMSNLGESLAGQGRFVDAERVLLNGYAQMRPPEEAKIRKREALERIMRLYVDWGQPDKAAEWRAKLPDEFE